jgi:dihydroorotase-like cyclic amidohydrolase
VRVEPDVTASKSHNTPFAGIDLPAKVVHVWFAGRNTVANGDLVDVNA